MIHLADLPAPTCPNDPAMWSHINGWEVVAAIMVIAVSWAAVSVARFHYMAVLGQREPVRPPLKKPPPREPDD